jgi:hypothetical protein
MQAEVPKEYWQRVKTMTKKSAAQRAVAGGDEWRPAPVPDTSSLTKVREAALHCTTCPLYKNATQSVFGEGPERPTLMLLGETGRI